MIATLFGSTVLILLDRETERVSSSPAAAQLVGEGKGARAGPGSLNPGRVSFPILCPWGQGKKCVPDV